MLVEGSAVLLLPACVGRELGVAKSRHGCMEGSFACASIISHLSCVISPVSAVPCHLGVILPPEPRRAQNESLHAILLAFFEGTKHFDCIFTTIALND